jgi:pimeloyl-ACP methyl ester carboxylesterase
MTTFALLHGSGDGGWAWHLVQQALRERGHHAVAPDLPTDRDDATWADCVDVVAAAAAGADDVVVVGHSSGGFVVPLAAERLRASLQVYVAGMVPQPGESGAAWFGDVGWSQAVAQLAVADDVPTDQVATCYHDVPAPLAREAMARERATSERLAQAPWPLPQLPAIPARVVVTTRDRFLPPALQRRVAAERLGVLAPDDLDAGHCANLSRPEGLADLLAGYVDG